MEERVRDCEREAEKETVREKGNKACDGSRDRNMGSHREERAGGAAAISVAVRSWSWGSGQPHTGLGERHPFWPLTVSIRGRRAWRQIHLWDPPLTSRCPGPWPSPLSAQDLQAWPPQGPSLNKLLGRWVRGRVPRGENSILPFRYLGVVRFVLRNTS